VSDASLAAMTEGTTRSASTSGMTILKSTLAAADSALLPCAEVDSARDDAAGAISPTHSNPNTGTRRMHHSLP
jgi:hypothetical protein